MNGTDLAGNQELQDEGLNRPGPPEEAIPGTPANNPLSYLLMVLLAILMIAGGLFVAGSLPLQENNQPLPGRMDNTPSTRLTP
jgi:hypothetical protein